MIYQIAWIQWISALFRENSIVLLLVYWPPDGIVIDHSSIGLKKLTTQLVFSV